MTGILPLHAGSFSAVKPGEDQDLVWDGGVKPPTEGTHHIRGGKILHEDCKRIGVPSEKTG